MPSSYLSLLEALRIHCQLPAFPDPIPSNQMALELEGGPSLTIDFNEELQMVALFAEIGTYPPEKEQEILSKIAQANFLWAATSGGTLSARPDIQTIYLGYQTAVENLDGDQFIQLVEKFVAVVQQWQTILTEADKKLETEEEIASTPSFQDNLNNA